MDFNVMNENETGTMILNAAFDVHKNMGPGLLESAYQTCLFAELISRGLIVESEVTLPLVYKGKHLGTGYRADLKVNQSVLVEIKSVEALNNVHLAQMITYLKLSGCRLGYLINFNVAWLKQGIKRVVL